MATANTVKGLLEEIIDSGIPITATVADIISVEQSDITKLKGTFKLTDGTNNISLNTDGSINCKGKHSSISTSITRTADTIAYAIGDVVGNATTSILTFGSVLGVNGGAYIIMGATLRIDVNAVPSGMAGFRLHLYNASPTNIADNAAFNLPSADRSKYLGYIELDTPNDFGDTLWSQLDNINLKRRLGLATTSVYAILETRGAFTPSSECVKSISLEVIEV